jgi:glycosyltransferase involved in cell wall biosynthesis
MPAAPKVVCVSSARAAHHPRHHYRLAAGLAAAGYDVVMLAQPDLTPGHEDAVPIQYLPVRSNRLTRIASAPLSMLRALRLRPDAIYAFTLDLLPWAVLLRLLRPGIAVVYDSNDEYDTFMLIKEWLPRPVRPAMRRIFRWLEPWLARRLDAATTALPATQEKFVAAGVRSTLVRNFPPAEIADGSPHGPDFDHDVLLGGSLPEEQIPLLAETARLLKQRQGQPVRWLTAVRNCSEADRQLLERVLDEAGVRDDFDLRYNRPFAEMKGLMARSRIGFVLYPSGVNYASRIPIRIFEYMAAGVPFVASDHPTTRLFAEGHDVAVLVSAGDTAAFAEALGTLLDDPERQRAMSERGPELVRESYNWELESRGLAAVFDELLGGKVRSSASSGETGGSQPSSEVARETS